MEIPRFHNLDDVVEHLSPAGNEHVNGKATSSNLSSLLWSFPLTDVGNAERFVALHGDDLHYCHPWGKWLAWDGMRWRVDNTAEVVRRAKGTTRRMFASALDIQDREQRERAIKHSLDTEKSARLSAMLELAAAEAGIPVLPEDLDAHPWLLNVGNGTLDLRTGELTAHRRSDLLTKLAGTSYDPTAKCPTWDRFQERVTGGNMDLLRFKQRVVGYALTGTASEKRSFFVYHGLGNNGKTTELETNRDVLGEYAGQVRIEALMEQKNGNGSAPSPDIADLRGKRLVLSSEPAEGARLSESLIKYLCGMGTIKARHLHREHFEFKQTWVFFLDCNHKPVIRGSDAAIWNRIGLVPFDVVIPDHEIDRDLPEKLRQELPGILAWMVRGCLEWQRTGLNPPDRVTSATSEYRSEMDIIGRFIEERCVVGDFASGRANSLYKSYAEWCQESGETSTSVMTFGCRLTERGFSKGHDRQGVRYEGIGLRNDK